MAYVRVLPVIVLSVFALTSCVETFDLSEMVQQGQSRDAWQQAPDETARSSQPVSVSDKKPDAPKPVVYKKIKSEKLLKEEGQWNLVEQSKSYDPAKAHMEARKNVNTSRRRNDKKLAAHFEPDAQSGRDGKTRVLRLDTGRGKGSYDIYGDVEVAGRSVVQPSRTVSGGGALQRIKSLFGGEDVDVQHNVIPKRKPVRGGVEPEKGDERVDVVSIAEDSAIIRPPALPARKSPRNKVKVSASDVAVVDAAGAEAEGVPVPKRKPRGSGRASAHSPVIQKGVMPSSALSVVNGVRAGVHNGRVRLVIEVKNSTRYKVAVDHLRKVLRVKLDKARWNINPQDSLAGANPLLGTYVARENKDGSVLFEVRLKGKSSILDTMILPPNKSPHHRIVIDLEK